MLLLTFLCVFVAAAGLLIAIVNKIGLRLMTEAQIASMAAILAAGGILFSLALVRQMIPGSRQYFSPGLLLTTSGIGVTAAIALFFPWHASGAFVSEGWPCATLELAIAVPASVIFWALARRGALFASAGLGATITALAVFLALIPLQAQCMFQQAPHLLVWHGGTAALLIALGALFGALRRHRIS
jgi:hypothetical protein